MENLTIEKMPVNSAKKLTSDVRNLLIKLLEQEFQVQSTLYHSERANRVEAIMKKIRAREGFKAHMTKINHAEIAREKLMNDHNKEIGELREKIRDLERMESKIKARHAEENEQAGKKLETLMANLHETGLCKDGSVLAIYHARTAKSKEKIQQHNNEINAAEEALKPANTMRSKIVARLALADTVGEACVILSQTLGNGLLPKLTATQVVVPELPAPVQTQETEVKS